MDLLYCTERKEVRLLGRGGESGKEEEGEEHEIRDEWGEKGEGKGGGLRRGGREVRKEGN